MLKGVNKSMSKSKVMRHFKVDPCLKICTQLNVLKAYSQSREYFIEWK